MRRGPPRQRTRAAGRGRAEEPGQPGEPLEGIRALLFSPSLGRVGWGQIEGHRLCESTLRCTSSLISAEQPPRVAPRGSAWPERAGSAGHRGWRVARRPGVAASGVRRAAARRAEGAAGWNRGKFSPSQCEPCPRVNTRHGVVVAQPDAAWAGLGPGLPGLHLFSGGWSGRRRAPRPAPWRDKQAGSPRRPAGRPGRQTLRAAQWPAPRSSRPGLCPSFDSTLLPADGMPQGMPRPI